MTATRDRNEVSRRTVMIGAAGLSFSVASGFGLSLSSRAHATGSATVNSWVTLGTDGSISIIAPAVEMGHGSRTSLPLILAEEMDADWNDVRILQAPPIQAIYGNPSFLGMLYTAGSTAVLGYFTPMRQFGAQVRQVLIDNAARHLGVPAAELTTAASTVRHEKSGRRLSYGDIAGFMLVPMEPPTIRPEDLKDPKSFRLIGKDVMRRELPTKVNGSARYSIDVEIPGMLHGAVILPPTSDSELVSYSDAKAASMPDVVGIYRLPIGIGVVAKTPWAAKSARNAIDVTWKKGAKTADFDSERMIEVYAKIARGEIAHDAAEGERTGDGAAGLSASASVVTGEFRCDYAYQAQMEPLNAVASLAADGGSVDLWCGTQSQSMAVAAAAATLGLTPQDVRFHEMLLGGGFGRRGGRDQDFILGALHLTRETRRPVKVMWTREDDLRYGRFRPMSAHHLRAGFDAQGKLTSWHHRVVSDNVGMFQDPVRYYGPWRERDMISAAGTELPTYGIPNRLSEHVAYDSGIRGSALRGIGFTANKFAIEAFIDDLARRRGIDPLTFRLTLLQAAPRARAVVQAVANMAEWGRKRDGRSLGLAYIDYSGTQIAGIAEVSVDRSSGQISVHNFWVAIDPGIAIQPDNVVAQTEGSVIYGLGLALTERVTITNGEVRQSNFYDYRVMRMRDVPQIHVQVISSGAKPTGAGQMATPLVAPAISNAVAALLGVRVTHTPMLAERVRAALKT